MLWKQAFVGDGGVVNIKRVLMSHVFLVIGALLEYDGGAGGLKVVPFYFMTLAAILMIEELKEH